MTSPLPSHFPRQTLKVAQLLVLPRWFTLQEIAERIGAPTQSVSARIRELRWESRGSHKVSRIQHRRGLFLYRLETRVRLREQLREARS